MPWRRFLKWFTGIFGRRKSFRLGIYGLPNTGKTSIANRICLEWCGQELGAVSELPHETRVVQRMREVKIRVGGKQFTIDLVDVPGVSYKKDLVETHYATFLAHMSESEAKKRVSEAIAGVKEAVKSLDHVDAALVVMDATQNPYNPVNSVIIGALESRDIPIIVVANKTDIKGASPSVIKEVYSDYPVVEMSCIRDKTFEPLYKAIAKHHKK